MGLKMRIKLRTFILSKFDQLAHHLFFDKSSKMADGLIVQGLDYLVFDFVQKDRLLRFDLSNYIVCNEKSRLREDFSLKTLALSSERFWKILKLKLKLMVRWWLAILCMIHDCNDCVLAFLMFFVA